MKVWGEFHEMTHKSDKTKAHLATYELRHCIRQHDLY